MTRTELCCALLTRSQRSLRHTRPKRLTAERLERRALLAVLTVDIADAACNDPGDSLFCQIQEAVDAASAGDTINVHAGTYEPFVVSTDNLTIREATKSSDPVIDGALNAGDENGIEVNADGVTIRGLIVRGSENGSFRNGFLVTGHHNTLIGNTASHNFAGFVLSGGGGNTLLWNTASDNSWYGLRLSEARVDRFSQGYPSAIATTTPSFSTWQSVTARTDFNSNAAATATEYTGTPQPTIGRVS